MIAQNPRNSFEGPAAYIKLLLVLLSNNPLNLIYHSFRWKGILYLRNLLITLSDGKESTFVCLEQYGKTDITAASFCCYIDLTGLNQGLGHLGY